MQFPGSMHVVVQAPPQLSRPGPFWKSTQPPSALSVTLKAPQLS